MSSITPEQIDTIITAASGIGGTLVGVFIAHVLHIKNEKIRDQKELQKLRSKNERLRSLVYYELNAYGDYLLELTEKANEHGNIYVNVSDTTVIKGKSVFSTFQYPELPLEVKVDVFDNDALARIEDIHLKISYFEKSHEPKTLYGTQGSYQGSSFTKEEIDKLTKGIKETISI